MANKSLLDGFGLKLPNKQDVKQKVSKVKEEKKVTKRNTISSSLSLSEKLQVINNLVNERLGKFRYNTQVIRSKEDLEEYLQVTLKNGIIAIDTETNNSIDTTTCKIMGMCIYTPGMKSAYIPINHINNETGELLENQLTELDLKEFIESLNETKIIMHNASFDIEVVDWTCMGRQNGLKCYWDTMLAAKILDENNSAKLKDLYQRFIDPEQSSYNIETFFKGIEYASVDPEVFALYAATDAYETYKLYEVQEREFKRLNDPSLFGVFMDVEMGVLPVVVQMEETGLGIDFEYANNLHESYNKKLEEAQDKLNELLAQYAPLIEKYKVDNPNHKLSDPILISSPSQLAVLLYDILKVEPPNSEKPKSTGEKDLLKIKHPIIKPILEFREYQKLVSTYVDALPNSVSNRTKKIHAHFNQIGVDEKTVVTGRFSSSNPNLQNIPSHDKKIRCLFRADEGMVIVGGDFSQQEPRLLAHYSNDKEMIDAYINGRDLYATMASKVYKKTYWECMEHHEDGSANPSGKKLRSNIKSLVLGILYGMGPDSIATATKSTKEEAQELIDTFYATYPSVRKWMDESVKMAEDLGYVTTICGRRRRLPNIQLPRFSVEDLNKSSLEESVLFENVKIISSSSEDKVAKYTSLMETTKSYSKQNQIIKQALEDGIKITTNGGLISGAKRQAVNARVQGGAADLSKRAMAKIYNDERLKALGFKTLFCVHDEIAGQCPVENAEEVAKYMKEDMIGSAAEICKVPMKTDFYVTSHWYADEICSIVEEAYNSMINNGKTREEALEQLYLDYIEFDKDIISEMCEGNFDCKNQRLARQIS